uniref:Replication protein A subunit n=1 Tax=Dermatophagoides pteronyssinus TaxID=6956 RepID=A0A6P6YLZ4_DERPT|nr:replication protein A 70 kDa DNA-binding subunit-like [Dermatophagoides pteronyssinus]
MSENDVYLSWGILNIILENRNETFQPVLQILCSREMSSSKKIRLALYDGRIVWKHCIVINDELNERFHQELLVPFTVIRIEKYQLAAKNDDALILLIENLSIIKNGNNVNRRLVKSSRESQELDDTSDSKSLSTIPKVSGLPTKSDSSNIAIVKPNSVSQDSSLNFLIDPQLICPINVLTPFYRTWIIRAWVMNKSSLRSFANGRIFHFDVHDQSGEIRITCFNEECNRYYNLIQNNKCYFVGKGTVRFSSNEKFNNIHNDYDISLNKSSFIHPCPLEPGLKPPKIRYKFVKLATIANLDKRSVIDVIAIIHSVDNTRTAYQPRYQKFVHKRKLTIVDDSKTKTILILHEDHAKNFNGIPGQVIAVRGAVVIENQGKMLSTFALPLIEPDLPETDLLKNWYQALSQQEQQQFLSLCPSTDQKINRPIQFTFIGHFVQKIRLEKILYSNIRCKIKSLNRPENHFYKSCPCCSKKLSDENNINYCIHCNFTFNEFKWRMILSMEIADWSDSVWVVAFHDQCEMLLDKSVEELAHLYQGNPCCYRQLLSQKLLFRTISIQIISRTELYDEEPRIRHTVASILPDKKFIYDTIKSIEFLKNNID